MVELIILKLLLYKSFYNKYIKYIEVEKSLKTFYTVLENLHSKHDRDILFSEFKLSCLQEDESLQDQLAVIEKEEVGQDVGEELIKKHCDRQWAHNLALKAIGVTEGRETIEALHSEYDKYSTLFTPTTENSLLVTDDFELLWEENRRDGGLQWRLPFMNKYFGGLRKGDFGFIFARTNTGKTSFLASEVSFMLKHAEAPICWFNNEEGGGRIKFRVAQSFFGVTKEKLGENKKAAQDRFLSETKGMFKLYDSATLSKHKIEAIVKEVQPSLIVIDNLDKLYGFKGDRHDLLLGNIYRWGRELAKTYAPVIGVCQAGATADNKKWLQLNDVCDAHVAKQAESDFILGIGMNLDVGMENIRYLHLVKNKFDNTESKFMCELDAKISRYKEK